MCSPLDLACHAANAVADGAKGMLEILVEAIKDAIAASVVASVTWWVHVPSPDVTGPAQTLQQWMLPMTALIATGGILWQALLMVITRKGEPMIGVLKGVVSVALWGAIAVGGTNLLLRASDTYSIWVLTAGLDGNIDALTDRLLILLVPNTLLGLGLLVGPLVAIAAFVQLALMFFRGGAIIILTGLLQLAAAGAFTNGTSGWLRKVLSWHLALIFYKPMAATIYAIAFMIMGDEDNDLHVWLIGVGMLGMSIIALPAMLRFLSWMVAGVQSGSGGLGMLAGAAGAGMHAAASMRGVTDQAKDMESRDNGRGSGGPSLPSSSPSGSASPSPTPPSYTGPAPASATGAQAGTGTASTAGASTAGTAAGTTGAAAATGTGAAAGGTAAAGGAAAGGAAAGGAAAAGAAAGPAAPVVAGAVVVGQAVVGTAKKAADETTKDGG